MAKISLSRALEDFLVDEAVEYSYNDLYELFVFRDILQHAPEFFLSLVTVQSHSHTWIKDYIRNHLSIFRPQSADTGRKDIMLEQLIKLYTAAQLMDVRSLIPHLVGPPGVGKSQASLATT